MGKSKKANNDGSSKFDGFGVDFKCKMIGFTDVPAPRGDDICQSAMTKLKMVALQKNKENKEHKQKITVNITIKGIRILDETTERIDHAHPIHRISFISHDNDDKRTFAYIVGTKEGYKLFAIKSMKEAEQITSTLKELFQEVFERFQAKKKEDEGAEKADEGVEEPNQNKNTPPPHPVVENQAPVSNEKNFFDVNDDPTYDNPKDSFGDWNQLNQQIQVMQNDQESFDAFGDNFTTSNTTTIPDPFGGDSFGAPKKPPTTQSNAFDDSAAFTAIDPKKHEAQNGLDFFASPQVPSRPVEQKPTSSADIDQLYSTVERPNDNKKDSDLLMNDPFADLKKNINEMHKQQSQQQQQQFGYFPNHQQQNGFQQTPFQPQQQQPHNPFAMQPPQQIPYNQPTVPPRPSAVACPNPFATSNPAQQDEFGWTVTKPTAAPRKAPTPAAVTVPGNQSDPFAFLNNQTGGSAANEVPQPQPTIGFSTQFTSNTAVSTGGGASGDILDFLG